jgi:hypothetical protein
MRSGIAAILACIIFTQPVLAETEKAEANWSASLSGGTATVEGRGDQPFFSIGLTRNFTDGYLRLTGTHIDTRDGQGLLGAVPAKTDQLSLAGGTSFGSFNLDGYASLGRRKFGAEAFQRLNGQSIAITGNGKTSAVGASLTYDVPVGPHGFFSPFAALDYSRVDTARAITVPVRGLVTQKEKQDGVTFTLGSTAQLLFGADDAHSVGLYGAFVTSSNATAYNRGTSPVAASRLLGALDVPGAKDSWAEYGATASFRIAKPLRLDLSLIRTTGFSNAESTSGSVGMRVSF